MVGNKVNVALLGIGNSANTFHIPFILAQPDIYTLHTIYERSATPEKSKARDKYGHLGVKVVTTLEEVLADPEVDLCVVAVKGDAHYDYAKKSLSAGKHVVLEKPVTATSAEVRDLIKTANEKKVVFAPYHNRRFDGDFMTVRKLIKEGKLPNIIDLESRYDCRADWGASPKPGGSAGIIYGLGSHLIDQAVALFGAPKSVLAIGANARGLGHPDVEDSFTIHLRYSDNPVVVTLRSALHSVMSHQVRFIVRSLNSSYTKYGLDLQEPQIYAGMKPLDKGFGVETPDLYGEYAWMENGKPKYEPVPTVPGSYIGYYRNVGETILGKSTLEVTGEQAEMGMRIIELAHKSLKEGKTVEFA